MQLTCSFRDKEDAEGVQLCKNLDTEEGLSDIKAFIELKYPQDASESAKPGGRKMPVRQSRYKVCMQAGLHKLVSAFCITPKELSQNLEGAKKHHPPDPAGTQFTSFTRTKVQIPTPENHSPDATPQRSPLSWRATTSSTLRGTASARPRQCSKGLGRWRRRCGGARLSSYYYICVLILLQMCPHTTAYVSSYYYIFVLILLHVSSYYYICVVIRLYVCSYCYICPHTAIRL
jgi:hypothetical protein